ncbi:MAG: glycosyltransferase family 2 protein [Acidobacteria bacterium]|nr:glycosyltransferase family 2 protein [Acidobacteriota bacterium]
MSPIKLSVIIPAYNERSTIGEIIHRVQSVNIPKEIIIVDDGSTDGTRDELEKIKREHDNVVVILQPRNMGKGKALRTGFAAARGDYVVVQDADLEYDPEDYYKLIAPLESGRADAVYGSRFITTQEHRVLYFWHSLGNKLLTLLSNMATDLNLTDMETCYKVFRRELIQSIELEEDRFGFEPEITSKLSRARARIYEVGIAYYGRTYEEGKKIGMKDGFRALWCILKYRIKPLRRK